MYIDQEACVGCGLCVPYCPVGAISVSGRKAVIDADACVECSCCRRSRVCRKDAICQEELKMPRAVRSVMSDVFTIFEDTGVSGRGTEEMKTNEVTGRFKPGWVGMALEAGRPIAAATFRQVQEIAVALAGTRLVEFETCNPITQMMKEGAPVFNLKSAFPYLIENRFPTPCYQCVVMENGKLSTCGRCIEVPGLCEQCGYFFVAEYTLLFRGNPKIIFEMLRTYLKYI